MRVSLFASRVVPYGRVRSGDWHGNGKDRDRDGLVGFDAGRHEMRVSPRLGMFAADFHMLIPNLTYPMLCHAHASPRRGAVCSLHK